MTNQIPNPQPAHVQARRAARTALSLLVAACFTGAVAAPTSPQVVAGQATFAQQGNVFSITNTPNTVINWQSFSVNAGDITRFIQQSSDSAVLNRIVGQDPTRILGALQSNGHVFLINPNGIMFGKDARVDVNGLTASTLHLSNADFLARKNSFSGGKQAGAIVNAGQIATPAGGKVFLIAPDIKNSGIITSPQGQVVLAAGHTVQLVDSGNPDLQVVVSAPRDQAINLGQIISHGGKVGIYGALVNQRGVVNADSAQVGANGKIVLRASRDSMLEAGSVTSATGVGSGGQVTVEGRRVGMTGDARIDASGAVGGGTVLLGGGFQGKDAAVANAQQTLLGKNASIKADATASGNGGTVVLWGDASTRALGSISAQGGAKGGNGGLIETSGKHLDVNGIKVNAGAAAGANGTWLLDPTNIEVTTFGTAGLSNVDEFADSGSNTQIHPNTISGAAPGTDVVLQATNNVVINAAINPPLTTGKLRIDAGNNIDINAPVTTAGGEIVFRANHPSYASGSGAVNMSAGGSLNSGGGAINLQGYAVNLVGPVSTGGGNFFASGNTLARFEGNISTSGGTFGAFANTLQFGGSGTSVNTGGGSMQLTAAGGNFVLDNGWTLSSSGFIDIVTNSAILIGNIGGSGGQRPVLTFAPYTLNNPINVSGSTVAGLKLDPADLQTFDVAGIVLGNSSMTGNINMLDSYSGGLANSLTLNTQGTVYIANPITLPAATNSALLIDIDGAGTGLVDIKGAVTADNITVVSNNMAIEAPVTANAGFGTLTLTPSLTTSAIKLGAGATDGAGVLGLGNSELANLNGAYVTIGGATGNSGAISVMSGGANFSSLPTTTTLTIDAKEANLTLEGSLLTASSLALKGNDLQTLAGAVAKAASITIDSTFGIGAAGTPFNTETGALAVHNNRIGGLAPIEIANTGALNLTAAKQIGTGNNGSVNIVNDGALNMPGIVMAGGTGNVTLKSLGAMTIDGSVSSSSGGILLEAANGSLMTIGANGVVSSGTGSISLTAGDIVNNGSVSTSSGNITVAAATVTGGGSFSAPGGTVNGATPPPVVVPPTVTECVANSTLDGCSTVLSNALNACIVNPAGPDCKLVLPTLDSCIAKPGTLGCAVVLPTLDTCVANPAAAGCSVVLPTLDTCVANPAAPGCTVVLPTLPACVAHPTAPGCSVVLPTLNTCIANPAAPGCSVVLPTLPACVADPAAPGCSVVLPTLNTCIANPAAPGCSVVLPTLPACVANPATAGCTVVLPTLLACVADKTLPGCSVVLPTLSQCIGNPAVAGCTVVLPSLAACIASPATAGCSVVLPSLAQCVANPALGGCSVVLPTLSQCIATPTLPGCAVVLPTLAQCTASPTLQGCSVVLPPVAACVANPAAPGCVVVVPPQATPPSGPVSDAINVTVNALNNATNTVLADTGAKVDKNEVKDKATSSTTPLGEKNDVRKKTYCN